MIRAAFILAVLAIVPAPVMAQDAVDPGSRGQVNGPTLGCPQESDIATFMASLAHSISVHDDVGTDQVLVAAIQAGCRPFKPGDTGLVIDTEGIMEAFDEVRMDSDQNAYWLPAELISPLAGQ